MSFRSALSTLFTPDSPVTLIADWFLDKADRQRIDAQILALQAQVTYSSLRGQLTTQVKIDSSSNTGAIGDVVCCAPTVATESDPLTDIRSVMKALATPISNAGVVFGVLVTAGTPNAFARVAVEGIIGPAITGLAAGNKGAVRLSSIGRCERVTTLASGDYPIGYVDAVGNLTLARGLRIP